MGDRTYSSHRHDSHVRHGKNHHENLRTELGKIRDLGLFFNPTLNGNGISRPHVKRHMQDGLTYLNSSKPLTPNYSLDFTKTMLGRP
jgi:hypothetical protein